MSKFGFIIFQILICSLGVVAQTTPELILPEDSDGVIKLDISYMSAEIEARYAYEHLSIFIENETQQYSSRNRIQGQHVTEGKYLVFKPYFPIENGLSHIVRIKDTYSDEHSYHPFKIEEKKTVADAKVVNIYPSADQLPANLLRFYIYFNTPMQQGEALKHIQLVDEKGTVDHHAFMEFKEELWSGDGKRLTIFFDPGRIKRGVATNVRRGPSLEESKQYHLCILNTWKDINGQPLEKTSKEIKVSEAYRNKIKVSDWSIHKPQQGSRQSIQLNFKRTMDHALIQSMLILKDKDENEIAGYWEVLEEEKLIHFIPEKEWKKGKYQIVIDCRLEDVSGNNLENPLDYYQTDNYSRKSFEFIYFEI